ncbi:MAG: F0F1 ATP synthase subunit B [Bacteroidales bacterium]|nr:F0F1 ATP synthase subunit B [Bacteroidales bacterium]
MGLLMPHFGTIIWMTISFIIVFLILKKFAWKPILNSLKTRDKSIEDALLSADRTRKEMQKIQADNEIILAEAKLERDKILKEARDLKENIINEAKQKAVEESGKILDSAREALKAERLAVVKEIKEQIAGLSIAIAEKILQEKLETSNEQKVVIEKFIHDLKLN